MRYWGVLNTPSGISNRHHPRIPLPATVWLSPFWSFKSHEYLLTNCSPVVIFITFIWPVLRPAQAGARRGLFRCLQILSEQWERREADTRVWLGSEDHNSSHPGKSSLTTLLFTMPPTSHNLSGQHTNKYYYQVQLCFAVMKRNPTWDFESNMNFDFTFTCNIINIYWIS